MLVEFPLETHQRIQLLTNKLHSPLAPYLYPTLSDATIFGSLPRHSAELNTRLSHQ